MKRVRVLLVEDHDDFLDGLSAWLAQNRWLDIVGRAHSGTKAIEMARELDPDLVLMDVVMPDLNGFKAAREIKSWKEGPVVVLMSFHDSKAAEIEASAAGADAFVSKSDITDRLLPILQGLLDLDSVDNVTPIERGQSPRRRRPLGPSRFRDPSGTS